VASTSCGAGAPTFAGSASCRCSAGYHGRMASAGDETYRYPDVNDHITLTLIDQREIPPEYGRTRNRRFWPAWTRCCDRGPLQRLLDYGSGGGRLGRPIRGYVRKRHVRSSLILTALNQQREFLATWPQGRRIRVVEDLSDAARTLMSCSAAT
jgi:hypothetical protein